MFSVTRFLQYFTVENHDGICPQHRQITRRLCHARLGFFPCQTRHILLCAFAIVPFFFNTRDDTFKSDTQLSE
ncbi:hypothetical protein D3C76_1387450 [compost metagenome]